MKRFTVGKSKSFNVMRRSNSSSMSSSSNNGSNRVVHSYDDLQLNHSNNHSHGGDSDSDSSTEPIPRSPIRSRELVDVVDDLNPDWSSWTRSIGLPLAFSMDSTGSSGHLHETRYQSSKRMRRTKGKFQPSYLLQRRKEALVLAQKNQQSSSSLQYLRIYSSSANPKLRHSCGAFLFLLGACYALLTLLSSSSSTIHSHTTTTNTIHQQAQSSSSLPYYYYLNMKEKEPMEIIAKMLTLHAYAHQLDRPAYFAGVCGYPTYQTSSQRQAMRLMEQLHLELLLPWDVCPPIEAIQTQDPHYILIEEAELVTLPRQDLFTTEWKEWMQSQRQTRFEQRQYLAMQQQSADLAANDNNKQSNVVMEEEALWKELVGESVSEGHSNSIPRQQQQQQRQLQGQPPSSSATLLQDKNNNNQGHLRSRRV